MIRPGMPDLPKIDGSKIMKGAIGVIVAIFLVVASFGVFEMIIPTPQIKPNLLFLGNIVYQMNTH